MKSRVRFVSVLAVTLIAVMIPFPSHAFYDGNDGNFSYYISENGDVDEEEFEDVGEYAEIYFWNGNTTTITIPETISYNGKNYPVRYVDFDVHRMEPAYGYIEQSALDTVNVINIPGSAFWGEIIGKKTYEDGYHNVYHHDVSSNIQFFNNLEAINVAVNNDYIKSLDGVVYSKDGKRLIAYPSKKQGSSFTIPDSVEEIDSGAFFYNYSLNGANTNLEEVELSSVKEIGTGAFRYCDNLKSATIPATVTTVGSEAFMNTGLTEVKILSLNAEIGDCAFGYNRNNNTFEDEKVAGFLIKCLKGSTAETYAKENGFAYEYISGDVHVHNLKHVSAVAATCTTNGNVEYWICDSCGKKFSDAESTVEISDTDILEKATGHKWKAWTTIKAATEIAAGEQSHKCTVCGITETKTIAQLAPTLPTVKIAKPKAAKKSATIKWKKVSKANQKKIAKIQIQYSTDKTFKTGVKTTTAKKSTASKKIKKLKSKKIYYVRVRAYKKVGNVIHVSKWSAVKAVKIK